MAEALTVVPESERNLRGLELAERHFPEVRRAQIASFLEVPADSPALIPYLAFCASLNLSPVAGHVWLIPKKIKASDGQQARTIYKPAIGRDGLLHKARETKGKPGGYKGMTFDVVCEGDTFEVERTIDPDQPPKVLHRYASKPTVFAAGVSPDRYRGRIIGAWACCYVDGEPPTFYYASLREHGKLRQVWQWNPSAREKKPLYLDANGKPTFAEFDGDSIKHRPFQEWEGAWSYTSSMVLKAAQSYVLRIALGITGVVPVDELRDPRAWSEGDTPEHAVEVDEPTVEAFDFAGVTDDEELRVELEEAVAQANELEPWSWAPAKCEMVLSGRSDDELREVLRLLGKENEVRVTRAEEAEASAEVVTGEVVEPEPGTGGDPASAERHEEVDQERVDVLRARLAKLRGAQMSATEEQQGEIVAELDQIEAELRGLLGLPPGADL